MSAAAVREGTLIEGFRLVRKIGEGGMGVIYEAVHESIKRRVAIKLLHPAFDQDGETVQRFLYEARAVNIVQHPGVVNIFGYGQLPGGTPYMIMEYLTGESLKAAMSRQGGRLPLLLAVQVCHQVAEALCATHDKHIIHRDLKPDNIMLLPDIGSDGPPRVKLFDFGIAKLRQEHMLEEMTLLRTQEGKILGTPHYMSPEQCACESELTERVDVYALGALIFRCLAGRPPFLTDTPGDAGVMQLFAMHIGKRPPDLRSLAPDAPEELDALLRSMLAKRPGERPAMTQVAAMLSALLARGLPAETMRLRVSELPTVSRPGVAVAPSSVDDVTRLGPGPDRRSRLRYVLLAVLAAVWFAVWALWALWR